MNKFLIIIILLLTSFYYSCEKPSKNSVDNKITLTKEERIQQRWENRVDTVSYAMGLDVAMRLEQQFDKFNHERIIQAIDDYYTGSRLFLSNKQRIDAITSLLLNLKWIKKRRICKRDLLFLKQIKTILE